MTLAAPRFLPAPLESRFYQRDDIIKRIHRQTLSHVISRSFKGKVRLKSSSRIQYKIKEMDAFNPVNHNTFNLNNCNDTDDDFHIF